jgi:hypothetical protein
MVVEALLVDALLVEAMLVEVADCSKETMGDAIELSVTVVVRRGLYDNILHVRGAGMQL